jgi:hypothetical protein
VLAREYPYESDCKIILLTKNVRCLRLIVSYAGEKMHTVVGQKTIVAKKLHVWFKKHGLVPM